MSNRGSARTPYERLLKAQCQKGLGASKSSGFVGKWGSTSFTSLRTASNSNGQKKFFKSRAPTQAPPPEIEPYAPERGHEPLTDITTIVPSKRPAQSSIKSSQQIEPKGSDEPCPKKRNKFFTSRARKDEPVAQVLDAVKIPPLKLRIKTPIPDKEEVGDQMKHMTPERVEEGQDDRQPTDTPLNYDDTGLENGSGTVGASISPEPQAGSEENPSEKPPSHKEKETARSAPKSKNLLDDWEDDDDATSSDDPEISFKDESLVMKSPKPGPSDTPLETLKVKAATVSTAHDLEKELSLRKSSQDVATSSNSQPLEDNFNKPMATKKRSIFKSKDSQGGAKKGLSLYKHKWTGHANEDQDDFKKEVFKRAVFGGSSKGFDFDDDLPKTEMSFSAAKLVRVPSTAAGLLDETKQEVMSVKCPKEQKGYYTVIKNVKKAHQIQDSGEFQEFNDDVEYILGGLGPKMSLSTRCLSTVTLASKCMEPGFRMHLRAHGTVTKFFAELSDSPKNASLALCAATVLFVLSQDRLNMDLDRDSLELMLNLLDTDSKIKDALEGSGMKKAELEKNKQKVQDLVAAMKKKGHAVNLSLDHISADHLAMETLLSLTSKRAGEWFKEELRELGGLDHLVRTMSDCVSFLTKNVISTWTDQLHDKLKKADRVLKVLENVTHENEENCLYLLRFENGHFLDTIHNLYKLLDEEVPLNPNFDVNDKESLSNTLRESLFDTMRVYINLVHDYHSSTVGSSMAGEKGDLLDMALHCLFILPNSIPPEKRFDALVLSLTLIINLVENCVPNRKLFMSCLVPDSANQILSRTDRDAAYVGMIKLFLEKEENARNEESRTDKILDGEKEEEEEDKEDKKSQEERIDETVAKLLHKAGRHMEDTLIAAYITLIIGYLVIDDKDYEKSVRQALPNENFKIMVEVLKKFFNFMNLTASATVASSRGLRATETIIKHMEALDSEDSDIKKETNGGKGEETFDDITLFDVTKDESTDGTAMFDETSNFSGGGDDFGKL